MSQKNIAIDKIKEDDLAGGEASLTGQNDWKGE